MAKKEKVSFKEFNKLKMGDIDWKNARVTDEGLELPLFKGGGSVAKNKNQKQKPKPKK